MNSTKHRKTLGTTFFIFGIIYAFAWIVLSGWMGGEWFTLMYSALFLLTGWKLHNEREGARILGIVSSLLVLPAFPVGTILGIYGLWYFLINYEG